MRGRDDGRRLGNDRAAGYYYAYRRGHCRYCIRCDQPPGLFWVAVRLQAERVALFMGKAMLTGAFDMFCVLRHGRPKLRPTSIALHRLTYAMSIANLHPQKSCYAGICNYDFGNAFARPHRMELPHILKPCAALIHSWSSLSLTLFNTRLPPIRVWNKWIRSSLLIIRKRESPVADMCFGSAAKGELEQSAISSVVGFFSNATMA